MAGAMEVVQTVTLGLVPPQITRDQVRSLRVDNVVQAGAKGFADLGIVPVAPEAVLPDYLWRFRPTGQFEAIRESARNLRA
jgi:NADH dehydrogenase